MKRAFCILIIFLFFNCNKGERENSVFKITESKKTIDLKPIFLNLNPKMSDLQFEEKLSSSSPNKKFTIPIGNYNFDFTVRKESERIILEYNDIKEIVFISTIGEKGLEQKYLKFISRDETEENLVRNFIKLFKSKYSKQITGLPILKNQIGEYYNIQWFSSLSEMSLLNYNFKEQNYLIFQDSQKTVIIGYTNADYPRKLDKKDLDLIFYHTKNKTINSNDRQSIKSVELFELYDLISELDKESRNLSPYQKALKNTPFGEQIRKKKGLSLEVNYMNNSDFEILKNKILKTNIKFYENQKRKDSIQNIEKNKVKNNITEL